MKNPVGAHTAPIATPTAVSDLVGHIRATRPDFRTRLTRDFTLKEFIHADDAEAFKNSDMRALYQHRLEMLALTLQQVRDELDMPLIITSGWRSATRNKKVGGVPTSDHPQGYCADVMCPYINADKLAACFKSARSRGVIDYDQLIIYPRHVHVSINKRMRGQTFRAAN